MKKIFEPTHLFSASGTIKPYAPVMVLRKLDDTSNYEVMIGSGNTFFANTCQLEKI